MKCSLSFEDHQRKGLDRPAVIIIPTYNERENLEPIVNRIPHRCPALMSW